MNTARMWQDMREIKSCAPPPLMPSLPAALCSRTATPQAQFAFLGGKQWWWGKTASIADAANMAMTCHPLAILLRNGFRAMDIRRCAAANCTIPVPTKCKGGQNASAEISRWTRLTLKQKKGAHPLWQNGANGATQKRLWRQALVMPRTTMIML